MDFAGWSRDFLRHCPPPLNMNQYLKFRSGGGHSNGRKWVHMAAGRQTKILSLKGS